MGDVTVSAFFNFMVERERLRLRKELGTPWPWSDDQILNTYKFTNVKREHDRTTRWMRENWTSPNAQRNHGEIIFNCALFRYFGTIEFASAIGWQRHWQPNKIISEASRRRRLGQRVFTGAYIVPTLGMRQPKHEIVCNSVLTPLWNCRNELADIASCTQSWRAMGDRIRQLPGFGGTGFMMKEVLQDVMQTPVLQQAIDRNTWCPIGPGARRGLNRLAGRTISVHIAEEDFLSELLTIFNRASASLPDFMPQLELHDIQFQLCEFDKYERVRLGEGRPKALYRRSAPA